MLDGQALYLRGFKLSKFVGSHENVELGATLGTPGYAAPEQVRNPKDELEPRSDLFSLGAILYRVISGEAPFTGRNPLEIILKTVDKQPKPLRDLIPVCSVAIAELCHALLSKEKLARPSLDEVISVLQSSLVLPVDPGLAPTLDSSQRANPEPALSDQSKKPSDSARAGSSSPISSSPLPSMISKEARSGLAIVERESYSIEGEFARGGLGRISKAQDTRLQRTVAVKELLKNRGKARERFFREALITAKLQHPGIVPIYEAGVWPTGEPFYTMKLISGKPFDKVIKEATSFNERLALLPHAIAACEAMAYAHSNHIIHRDLKPHNMIVGAYGETIVIDWGLAKELKGDAPDAIEEANQDEEPIQEEPSPYRASEQPSLTGTGEVIGTPAYMPLEQAQGQKVDARADVYSLGGILYHMLTGQPPYVGKKSLQIIRDLLEQPPAPLEEKEPNAPKDLIAIINKAMARDLNERYPTAKELVDDLKKFQTGQLVGAYRYSFTEQLKRWVSRNKKVLSVAAIALVAMVAFGAYSFNETLREKNRAEANERLAKSNETLAKSNEEKANETRDQMTQMAMESTLKAARSALDTNPRQTLRELKKLTEFPGFDDWDRVRMIAADAIYRGVPTELGKPEERHTKTINAVEYSPDGSLIATASNDGTIKLWDTTTHQTKTLSAHKGVVWVIKFSHHGGLLASGGEDGIIRLWDTKTGKLQREILGHKGFVMDLAFSHDDTLLASTSRDLTTRLFDLSSGKELWSVPLSYFGNQVDFSPDDRLLVNADFGGPLHLINVESGKDTALPGHTNGTFKARFSPDGSLIASAGWDGIVRLWEVKRPKQPRELMGHTQAITELSFSPSGRWLVSAGLDGTARLWPVQQCKEESCEGSQLVKTNGGVNTVSFSSDSAFVVVGSSDSSVYLARVQSKRLARTLAGHSGFVWGVSFSPNTDELVSVGGNELFLWSMKELETQTLQSEASINSVDLSPDGRVLATARADGMIELWDPVQQNSRNLFGHEAPVSAVTISKNNTLLASGDESGQVLLWDFRQTLPPRKLGKLPSVVYELRFSHDGEWLAATEQSGIALWDLRTLERKSIPTDSMSVDFSADNETLASVGSHTSLALWSVREGRLLKEVPLDHLGRQVRFLGSGGVAVGGVFAPIYLLNETTSQRLSGHQGSTEFLSVSKSTNQLLSANTDGTVRLWDLQLLEGRTFFSDAKAPLFACAFSVASGLVVFADTDGLIYLIKDETVPKTKDDFRGWLGSRAP